MKTLKSKLLTLIALAVIFSVGVVKADNNEPSTISSLGNQIQKELVDIFKTPVWLNFQDKNLNGIADVTISVDKNGKIVLKTVTGENNILNTMVENKINSLNLWTDTKYANRNFNYKIVSK